MQTCASHMQQTRAHPLRMLIRARNPIDNEHEHHNESLSLEKDQIMTNKTMQ